MPPVGRALMPVGPAPFLKWAGGKRQLLPRILASVPPQVDTYYEPFLGGGAVFFAMARAGRFRRAVVGDANEELVSCYRAIQGEVEAVIRVLVKHRYDEEYYYSLRDRDLDGLDPPQRAARLIYLNRCGYNGLYRVNSAGRFNVPFGRYTKPVICDEDKLRAAATALRNVEIRPRDFEDSMSEATDQDFVYLDPPYVPLSKTSSFTSYARAPFGAAEQDRLARALRELGARGVRALLSNSDSAVTRKLYRGLPRSAVPVRRAINSAAAGRGAVGELLVKSFRY